VIILDEGRLYYAVIACQNRVPVTDCRWLAPQVVRPSGAVLILKLLFVKAKYPLLDHPHIWDKDVSRANIMTTHVNLRFIPLYL
jgi:hypothetical protein